MLLYMYMRRNQYDQTVIDLQAMIGSCISITGLMSLFYLWVSYTIELRSVILIKQVKQGLTSNYKYITICLVDRPYKVKRVLLFQGR